MFCIPEENYGTKITTLVRKIPAIIHCLVKVWSAKKKSMFHYKEKCEIFNSLTIVWKLLF